MRRRRKEARAWPLASSEKGVSSTAVTRRNGDDYAPSARRLREAARVRRSRDAPQKAERRALSSAPSQLRALIVARFRFPLLRQNCAGVAAGIATGAVVVDGVAVVARLAGVDRAVAAERAADAASVAVDVVAVVARFTEPGLHDAVAAELCRGGDAGHAGSGAGVRIVAARAAGAGLR